MKRQRQLTVLIALSSISAVALYVVQGALATGADVSAFPSWFWVLDYCLWGARALIEAAVIVYLFSTHAETKAQSRTLAVFEFALIALITLTVGPALRAVGLRQTMAQSVSAAAFTAWSFGIAAYTSLMVGAAGYAYRVQPDDADARGVAQLESERDEARALAAQLSVDNERLVELMPLFESLPKQTVAELYALARSNNGDGVTAREAADAMRISLSSAQHGVRAARERIEDVSEV